MVNGFISGLKVAGKVLVTVAVTAVGAELGFAGGQMIMNDAMYVADVKPKTEVVKVKKHLFSQDVTVRVTDPLTGGRTYSTFRAPKKANKR